MKTLMVAIAVIGTTLSLHGQSISEENFNSSNYTVGSDLSGTDPTVTGYSGSWIYDSSDPSVTTDGTGSGIVTSGPLSYPGITSSGNTVVSSSGSWIVSRSLDTAGVFSPYTDANGDIGSAGTTLYTSFLLNLTTQPTALNESVLLTNGLFGANGSTTGVGGIYLGYAPLQSTSNFTAFLTDTNGDPISGQIGELGAVEQGVTNLFVIKTQFGLDGTDTVSFYDNTTDENDPDLVLTTTGLNYNTLSLLRTGAGSGTLAVSDIRMGTSFASVAAVPEPVTYWLMGLGLGFLWLLRRGAVRFI
jgi:hypothetical protein